MKLTIKLRMDVTDDETGKQVSAEGQVLRAGHDDDPYENTAVVASGMLVKLLEALAAPRN